MPIYHPQRTWATGERIKNFWFNNNIRDAQGFLRSPPGVRIRAKHGRLLNLTENNWTAVTFEAGNVDEKHDDPDDPLFSFSNPGVIKLPVAGLWHISANLEFRTSSQIDAIGLRAVFTAADLEVPETIIRIPRPFKLPNALALRGITLPGLAFPSTQGRRTSPLTFGNAVDGGTTAFGGETLAYIPDADHSVSLEARYKSDGTANADLTIRDATITARWLSGVGTSPAWTAPKTWVDGDQLTAALLNAHVRDNHDHLYYRPACVVGLDADQSLNTATWTTWAPTSAANVWFDNTNSAGANIWDSANPARLTPGLAGKWLIYAKVKFQKIATGSSATPRGMRLRFNGNNATTVPLRAMRAAVGLDTVLSGSQVFNLSATDYVELQAVHSFGSTLDLEDGSNGAYGDGTQLGCVFMGV
jgi:hypothetical protein